MEHAEKILNHFNIPFTTDGKGLRCACPIHNGNNPFSFVLDKETLLWYCHSCHAGGTAQQLVKRLGGTTLKEIIGEEHVVPQVELERREAIKFINSSKIIQTPKPNIFYGERVGFNRFEEETLEHFNAVPCKEVTIGYRTYQNKLVIPNEAGYGLRSLDGTTPKWIYTKGTNLSTALFKLGKKDYKKIVIVEGAFDVFAFYEAMKTFQTGQDIEVMSTFTCHMSKEQANRLIKENKPIILCYDGDEAGRNGNKQAYEMLLNKTEVSILELPDGKDPDDLKRWELGRIIESYC